jgi:hypothetical protein
VYIDSERSLENIKHAAIAFQDVNNRIEAREGDQQSCHRKKSPPKVLKSRNIVDETTDSVCRQFDDEINTRATSELGSLTRTIERKLPRELRDIIYEHVCVHSEPVVIHKKIGDSLKRDTSVVYPDNDLLKPRYVGDFPALEMHENYWSLNIFDMNVGPSDEYYGLDNPIREAGHRIGESWISAYRRIRHVRVHVDTCSALGPENYNSLRGAFSQDTPLTIGQLCMVLIHRQLRSLLLLKQSRPKRRSDRHVEFIIHTSFVEDQRVDQSGVKDDEPRFTNTLEVLRRFIYGLKYSGITITVTLSNKDPESLSNASVATWEFTPYLCLSAEEWAMVRHGVGDTSDTCADNFTGRH